MKKTLLKIGVIIACTLVFTYSCQDDPMEIPDQELIAEPLSVAEARSWFETNSSPILSMSEGLGQVSMKSDNNGKGPKRLLQPDWTHAFTSTRGHLETVETHLRANLFQGRGNAASKAKMQETGNFGYMVPLSRLVVLRDRKKNTTESFIMTMTGDVDYIESKNYQLWTNTYFQKDHNFSGTVRYHNLEGNFVNGWQMENGKVTGKFIQLEAMPMTPGETCTVHWESVITLGQCWTDLQVGEIDDPELYSWEATNCNVDSIEHNYLGTTCHLTIEDTRTYVNPWIIPGGGGDPVPPVDKFAKTGLATTMDEQIGDSCTTAIMGYINEEFCGGGRDQNYYSDDYHDQTGRWVHFDGFDSPLLEGFMDKHFVTQSPYPITEAIDDGNVVMTNVPSSIANSTHNVVIVGYADNGDFIYMDPEKGRFVQAPSNEMSFSYAYIITGCN